MILPGMKTYIVSMLFAAYAGLGWLLGELPDQEAVRVLLEGAGLAALRGGIGKI